MNFSSEPNISTKHFSIRPLYMSSWNLNSPLVISTCKVFGDDVGWKLHCSIVYLSWCRIVGNNVTNGCWYSWPFMKCGVGYVVGVSVSVKNEGHSVMNSFSKTLCCRMNQQRFPIYMLSVRNNNFKSDYLVKKSQPDQTITVQIKWSIYTIRLVAVREKRIHDRFCDQTICLTS